MGENEIEDVELESAELSKIRYKVVGVSMMIIVIICILGALTIFLASR